MTDNRFDEALTTFVNGCQKTQDEHFAKHYPGSLAPKITTMTGNRYVRVVIGGRSVHCFVDMTTGDVLKAAGWKAPAKNPRGNIYSPLHGMEGMTVWGARYLR
ncbi:hypothetical protein LCGC14_1171090 [marine sediment metagenome]|uniref:Uncharacterized protein n=1 Tax=marine sediment metagenome TaxID=412755 RepID=A0A0F9P801_9ZZZZ